MNKLMIALGLVAIIAATSAACYFTGMRVGFDQAKTKYDATLASISAEHTRQLAIAITAARTDERRRVMAQDFIDRNLYKELNDEKAKTAALSAAVSAGTVQLRQRFTCPASASGGVPGTATSISTGDAAAPGGLQQQDAQFLIRLASEADQTAMSLQACQAIVASDRSNAADLVD
jgi:hypothetical protein